MMHEDLNKHPELLRVGMKVTTKYIKGQENQYREVLEIKRSHDCSSGYLVLVTSVGQSMSESICPHCGRGYEHMPWLDGGWIIPAVGNMIMEEKE
jgi:hypothetical protein